MRNITVLLILFSFLFFGCNNQKTSSQCEFSSQKTPVKSVLEVPSENMRETLVEAYRLRPDKRFLLAVAEVHHFLSGQDNKESVSAEFRDGHWEICYRNIMVGVLPELPDFPDLMEVLSNWVKVLNREYPLRLSSVSDSVPEAKEINKDLEQFLSHNAITAVKEIDELWGKGNHHPELLRLATRAMVLINMQKLDYMEIADILPAKTMTILAVSKTLTDADFSYEESLLAYTMGYSAYASKLAEGLPSTNALRLHLTQKYKALKELAIQKNGSFESKYLWLIHLAKNGDVEEWYEWQDMHFKESFFSLPVLKLGLIMDKFAMDRVISQQIFYATVLALGQDTDMPDFSAIRGKTDDDNSLENAREISELMIAVRQGDSSKLIEYLDDGLLNLRQKHKGTFLDSDTYAAYYKSYFFSALYTLGLHYKDSLSSIDATKEFAKMLGNSDSALASDFRRWYNNLANAKAGNPDKVRLKEDISTLASLGAPPIYRTFNSLKRYYDFGDPEIFALVRKIVKRMDTRVYHRNLFSRITRRALYDLRLTEKLYRTVVDTDPMRYHSRQVWFAGFTRDEKLLKTLLYSPMLNAESRAVALWHIEQQKIENEQYLTREYKRLVSENPDSWKIRERYMWFLARLKKFKEARTVIQDWIDRKVTTAGLEEIFAYRELARMYYKEGLYAEGLKAVEPVADSMQGGTMEIYAMILDELERTKEAEEMYRKVIIRYPYSLGGMASYAKFLWQHGRYAEAAKLIKEWRYPINFSKWQHTVGAGFAEVFSDRPADKGFSAFSALVSEGINHWNLLYIPKPVAESGNNELAFKMQSELHGNGLGNLVHVIEAYGYLKNWQGKEKALEWLRKRVPQHFINASSMIIFSRGKYDLLWDLIQEPDKGGDPEFVWLLRAAALEIQNKNEKNPRYKAVLKYFEEHKSGHYQVIGRYLLDLETEEKVFTLATNAMKRCEVAYYVGLKNQAEGFYDNASDWFHVAVETEQMKAGEYSWALYTLYDWYTEDKSLSQILRKH